MYPNERQYKVSCEAIDLISHLLREKQQRLCSRKYMLNDYQRSKHDPSKLISKCADPSAMDYKGRFVYPDDASDIKSHAFFDCIAWDRHHLTRPPFVPDTDRLDDTRYFDEEPISDSSSTASHSRSSRVSEKTLPAVHSVGLYKAPAHGADGHQDDELEAKALRSAEVPHKVECTPQPKTKRRPRDKVLRDRVLGKRALEVRKKGAFIGYTYRRPKQYRAADRLNGDSGHVN